MAKKLAAMFFVEYIPTDLNLYRLITRQLLDMGHILNAMNPFKIIQYHII